MLLSTSNNAGTDGPIPASAPCVPLPGPAGRTMLAIAAACLGSGLVGGPGTEPATAAGRASITGDRAGTDDTLKRRHTAARRTTTAQRRLVRLIEREARAFLLDPRLVLAVIEIESGFDPRARSPRNAQGLMQLVPATAQRFNVADAFDPVENLRGGMAYLRWLIDYDHGNVTLALAGYNAGEGAVDRHGGVPPYPETVEYVRRISERSPAARHPVNSRRPLPVARCWIAARPDTASGGSATP